SRRIRRAVSVCMNLPLVNTALPTRNPAVHSTDGHIASPFAARTIARDTGLSQDSSLRFTPWNTTTHAQQIRDATAMPDDTLGPRPDTPIGWEPELAELRARIAL